MPLFIERTITRAFVRLGDEWWSNQFSSAFLSRYFARTQQRTIHPCKCPAVTPIGRLHGSLRRARDLRPFNIAYAIHTAWIPPPLRHQSTRTVPAQTCRLAVQYCTSARLSRRINFGRDNERDRKAGHSTVTHRRRCAHDDNKPVYVYVINGNNDPMRRTVNCIFSLSAFLSFWKRERKREVRESGNTSAQKESVRYFKINLMRRCMRWIKFIKMYVIIVLVWIKIRSLPSASFLFMKEDCMYSETSDFTKTGAVARMTRILCPRFPRVT